ncbi:hypothetical protein DHEL01_v200682 [Diaporthe helianthi]|uniref:Uncharacterized protein n=1 Tax=Diaporthe helianthi TaxID=158607 RepID=A0A2P5IEI5_DIAHE|nr:hypothetical protein DHEL01_v200682 [Diaporthe helianthi]
MNPEDSRAVRCGAGAIHQNEARSNKEPTDGVQLPTPPTATMPQGAAAPFRFASSLHRDATKVAASSTTYRPASYDPARPQSSAGGRWWLAGVGIGHGLLRSSI